MVTRTRIMAALAATGLALGAMGLMTPSASAATATGSERVSGPFGNNGCHTDPYDGGFYCTIFDISPVAKPVLDVAVGVTCLNKETKDFIICMVDQDKPGSTEVNVVGADVAVPTSLSVPASQ